jgi:(p)ppGpp synthase/HD superfamily hydrolase
MNEQLVSGVASGILGALRFAAEKHGRQRRKDSDATPYINHPIAVAEVLARIGVVVAAQPNLRRRNMGRTCRFHAPMSLSY